MWQAWPRRRHRWAPGRAILGALGLGACLGGSPCLGADAPAFSLSFHDGLYTLTARGTPLGVVLAAMADAAGLRLRLAQGAGDASGDWFLRDQPLEPALRKVLGCHGWVLTGDPVDAGGLRFRGDLHVLACGEAPSAGTEAVPAAGAGSPTAEDLVESLRRDGPRNARATLLAIEALGPDQGLPALERALGAADPAIRTEVLGAMGRVGGDRALRVVGQAAIGDRDPAVRRAAIEVLGASATPQARSFLQSALKDPDAGVRRAAAGLLGEAPPAPPAGPRGRDNRNAPPVTRP